MLLIYNQPYDSTPPQYIITIIICGYPPEQCQAVYEFAAEIKVRLKNSEQSDKQHILQRSNTCLESVLQ